MHSELMYEARPRARGMSLPWLLTAALILAGTQVHAAPSCRTVQGSASLIPVPEADCTSPVQICGEGNFTGGLKGSYTSVLFTLTPTADTPVTQVVFFTAETTMPAARIGPWRGQLVFKEAGSFHVAGAGEFGELYSAAGGTGDFVAATGVLRAVGTFDAVIGGEIAYDGQICVPQD